MPIMDAAYMLRTGIIALVIAENNALLTDGWIDCGNCPLGGAKLVVYRPTAVAGAAVTLTIQSSPDAGVTAGLIDTLAPGTGWPAGGAFTAAANGAGTETFHMRWDHQFLRYVANPVVVGFGQVQIGVTPGEVFST